MTCIAPTNEMFNDNSKYFPHHVSSLVRKHYIEESSSDEELHFPLSEKQQTLDRLKEIHDLSLRATLLNAEERYRYADEPMSTNNRKRLFSEYNSSPEFRNEDGRYKLTLSQFATSASEQEPLYADDEDVEEILMRLRHGHDYYQPKASSSPPTLPSLLFAPPPMSMHPYHPHAHHPHAHPHAPHHPHHPHHYSRPSEHHPHPHGHPHPHHSLPHTLPYPPVAPAPNKASLFHILSQESDSHHAHAPLPPPHPHPMSVNNLHMRKLFFEEVMESSDEMGLEHPKKKARRENKANKSPLKSIIVSNNDDVQEKETVAAGLCFKTHKPKVQREYYYAKLSKTIFRWTCCGSQAKTHPDA